jgi:hypothetical protein
MKAEERRKNVEQQSNEGTKLFDAFVALFLCCSKNIRSTARNCFSGGRFAVT